jgi:UDP-2,3-diacylglucosamine hydrolase
LADVHLDGFDAATNEALDHDAATLIDHCAENGIRVFFLGDLFDAWMEYPQRKPDFGRRFRDAVRRYAKRHGPIRGVTGNHDNWTLGLLAEEGFELGSESIELSIAHRRVLLLHGDGLADAALGLPRPFYHRILRHKAFVSVYRFLFPFDRALTLMAWFSRRQRSRHPEPDDTETLDRWAASALKRDIADVIIAGHHHEVRHVKIDGREYLNTGALYRTRTLVMHTNGQFNVVVWDSQHQRFKAAIE